MRKRSNGTALPRMIALLFVSAVCTVTASAQSPTRPTTRTVTVPPSSVGKSTEAGIKVHTNVRLLGAQGVSGTTQTYGPPAPGYLFETPASLACIYSLQPATAGCNPNVVSVNPVGGSHAIAIVDAYDYAVADADLQAFVTQFGITAITPSSFEVVYAPTGSTTTPGGCVGPATRPPSSAGTGWDIEEALDIEYAHAMAPQAKLYLVEAQSNYNSDLYCAVSLASKLVEKEGGGQVSMSWGGGEFQGETVVDCVFTGHNVVYYAATGDSPGTIYPSVSPNVIAVGGTTLSSNLNTGEFTYESTWQDAGGGSSQYEARPAYQNGIAYTVGSQRGVPDFSAVANPNTGVWVYNSTYEPPYVWWLVGGTSLATPLSAGIANELGHFAPSSYAELSRIYAQPFHFRDTTFGNCGIYIASLAGPGWDFCTGWGSPQGYK